MHRSVSTPQGRIEYDLVKTGRSNLAFKVLPDGTVRVLAPSWLPLKEADRAVAGHAEWIGRAQGEIRAYAEQRAEQFPMTDGMRFPLRGHMVTLRLTPAARRHCEFSEDEVRLSGPDLSPQAVRAHLQESLIEYFRGLLEQRLAHYIPLIGRQPGRITIRAQKTRWGSCSSQHNLNFNWLLVYAPEEALDYVVIHELCHLYEFNHSPQFWARVARYQPDYALWRDWLRSGWTRAIPISVL